MPNSYAFKAYGRLVNYGYKKDFRVKHSENEFPNGTNHINVIEKLGGFVKSDLLSLEKYIDPLFHTLNNINLDIITNI